MRVCLTMLLGGLAVACTPGVVVEVALPADLAREDVRALRVVAVAESAVGLGRTSSRRLECGNFTALPSRRGHLDTEAVARRLSFPLQEEASLEVLGGGEPGAERVFVHVVAIGAAEQFTGAVGQGRAGLAPAEDVALAEGCACVEREGDEPGACDARDARVAVTLASLIGSSSDLALEVLGGPEAVAVRGRRSVLTPTVHVRVPACPSDGELASGCLECTGRCSAVDLPLAVAVLGDPEARPAARVVTTDAAGDAVVAVEPGACPSGAFVVEVGLLGHDASPVRIPVTCVDALPPVRGPTLVRDGPETPLVWAAVGPALVMATPLGASGARVEVLRGSPPAVVATRDLADDTVIAVAAAGSDALVLATRARGAPVTLRRWDLALVEQAAVPARCDHAGCALANNGCTKQYACGSAETEALSLDVRDVDGDGSAELTVLRAEDGLTLYDARTLGACRRLTSAPATAFDHLFARLDASAGVLPTLLVGTAATLALAPPVLDAPTGPPCDPAAPTCGAGLTCVAPCGDAASCASTAALHSGVCVAPCAEVGRACGRAGRCRAAGGGTYCLEPGPSCATAMPLPDLLVGGGLSLARARGAGASGLEDVVTFSPGGAARILRGRLEPLDTDAARARWTPLPLSGTARVETRTFAVGDLDGDGDDDVVVGADAELRVWLAGAGSPGEAGAVALPGCRPEALALPDLDGDGRAEALVGCAGRVWWVAW